MVAAALLSEGNRSDALVWGDESRRLPVKLS